MSTTFGRTPVPQTTSTLNSLVPTQSLLGVGDAESERRLTDALNAQYALEAFKSTRAGEQANAQSVAQLFGLAAGTLRPTTTITLPKAA